MFDKQIEDFIELTADLMPGVFADTSLGNCEVHDYYAIIEFNIGKALSKDDVLDMLEDNMEMTVMYVHHRSVNTDMGVSLCAYSDHSFDDKFAVHALTDADGLIHRITATLFFSVEVMMNHLVEDLEQHTGTGTFEFSMSKDEVMTAFC